MYVKCLVSIVAPSTQYSLIGSVILFTYLRKYKYANTIYEFIKTISESWLKPIDISLDDFEKLVFNPFTISDYDFNSPLCDTDPDIEFYNNSEPNISNNILKSCSYFVEDSFNKKCLELRNESDLFSVIHLNARSIPKNFDNFPTF